MFTYERPLYFQPLFNQMIFFVFNYIHKLGFMDVSFVNNKIQNYAYNLYNTTNISNE
jgi:hypothetical protein